MTKLLSKYKFFYSMRVIKLISLGLTLILSSISLSIAGNTKITGDILQAAIPLSALIYSEKIKDREGIKELAKSYLSAISTTHILKVAINRERPNGGNHSFPSGHTASAFSGAFYVFDRYGFKYGVPALVLAGITGYTRVKVKAHYTSDVLTSIVISGVFSKIFINKYNFQAIYEDRKIVLSLRMNI